MRISDWSSDVCSSDLAKPAFADIFELGTATGGACADGFKSVNTNGAGQECLKLKTGQEKAAAFLETRRYAAYLGATTELRNAEAVSFAPDGKNPYVAYSAINNCMDKNTKAGVATPGKDIYVTKHHQLPQHKDRGP